ncbi:MAG: TolC family protein [Anaeromyxobacteraceae bacterium]
MPPSLPRLAAPAALLLALAGSGCATLWPPAQLSRHAPPPREIAAAWPAAPAVPAPTAPPAPPAGAEPAPRSLTDLVDRALRTDPATRAVWQDARAAAAEAGARRADYLPAVTATGNLTRVGGLGPASTPESTTASATAALTWLLLDVGGRGARAEEGDLLLEAARLAEHAAVADLVLSVQQTYYQLLAARALAEAEGSTVKQAAANLEAAEGRRRSGLATVADVLAARTQLAQLRLSQQQLEGQALALRGALATLAGLEPTAELEVGALPTRVDAAGATPRVEAILAEAAARNPDLGRARALAGAADARARAARSALFPTLSAQASATRAWPLRPADGDPSTLWSAGLVLRFPLFEGLGATYDVLSARASAEASRLRADATAQRVALDVWTNFQALRTAGERLESARALLESATASAEVAAGRYHEGVGSILDLLNAQAALEGARAEDVRARADWLLSVARLARAAGRLDLPEDAHR